MPELVFDSARHEYRLGGRVLPSVTSILAPLQDFGSVPAEVLERAAEFGSHVHQAVHLFNEGTLDEDALDPALVPYLHDWKKFICDLNVEVTQSELRMTHSKLGFAGTVDSVAIVGGKLTVIDVKTGQVPRSVGPQLAAYAELLKVTFPKMKTPVRRRLAVQLTGEGYRLHQCTDPSDWSVFQSCLNVHHWKYRNAA